MRGFRLVAASVLMAASLVLPVDLTADAAGTADCGGAAPPQRPGGGSYTCTFSDDFAGSSLDTSKWLVQETAWSGFGAGEGSNCYLNSRQLIGVGNGKLRLTTRMTEKPFVCKSPLGSYSTRKAATTVTTATRFSQAYGRFEFRAKFAATTATGIASGLWLYPQKQTYGGWPHSGEIDVAEWFSRAFEHVHASAHYSGEVDSSKNCRVSTANAEFHTYAVDWTPRLLRFEYDGTVCFEHTWTPAAPLSAPQPFDQPFYLVLTQQFGDGWNYVDDTTPTSASLVLDWVRAWA